MARFRLGVTGGLASGKSTVAGWLGEAGFLVVDADRLVAQLHAPGGGGAAAVRELFGDSFLTPEGAVDPHRVADRIFADPAARRRLEQAVHPLVQDRFRQIADAADGVVVLEATLMVESGHSRRFDLVVTVEADEQTRLGRAVARGMDEAAARARITAQGDGAHRRAGAHRILENRGSLADLRREVEALVAEVRERSGG